MDLDVLNRDALCAGTTAGTLVCTWAAIDDQGLTAKAIAQAMNSFFGFIWTLSNTRYCMGYE